MMIVMVGLTVLSTVALANISSRSWEPVPAWIDLLVLQFLSHIVCFHQIAKEVQHKANCVPVDLKTGARTQDTSHRSIMVNENDSVEFHRSILTSLTFPNMMPRKSIRNDTVVKVSFVEKWNVIAIVVSRCFALLFTIIMVTCTITILLYIKFMSEIEFENALGENRDRWLNETFFSF